MYRRTAIWGDVKAERRSFWEFMDYLIDGPPRPYTMVAWACYLAFNLGIMAAYCYSVTPQWH
jgi:hypothetical protein